MNTSTLNEQTMQNQELVNNLNASQKEAVCLGWGSSLIIAGAGSGKTTVLTKRVAYLLSVLKQPAYSILAVTFTNKAAGEMRTRLEGLMGPQTARQLSIGTFHSVCAKLLRQEIENYKSEDGYQWKNNFVIYDESDSLSLVKNAVTKLNLDEKVFSPKEMRHAISALKNDGKTSAAFSKEARNYKDIKLSEIFTLYQAGLARNNALDFDDLILVFGTLLEQNDSVRLKLRERFQHVLVDEFQDTNQSQYKLIRALCPHESGSESPAELEKIWDQRTLMVVGDVDQSIYSWRKADFRIIMGFQHDYRQSTLIKLEDNYRSTATILDVANSIIKNNSERIDKVLRCNRGAGGKVKVHAGMDEIDEAYFVVEELKRLQARNISLSKSSILYRTNAQSRAMEEVLVRSHLPYIMVGGTRFYDRAEIKDVIAYLKLIYNSDDGQSFLRSINTPKRGLGKTSIEHLSDFAELNNISLPAACAQAHKIASLSPKTSKGLADFASALDKWQNLAAVVPVSELLDMVLKQSGYLKKLEEDANGSKDETAYGRLENVRELLSVAKEFESIADEPNLESFLTRISLVSDLDALKNGEDSVKLMTLHSAKGLEFENVFLMGLEEGLFPHVRSLNSPTAMEEERRLMYVGVTRAEERLYLSYARKRASFTAGNYGSTNYTIASRFLKEISPDLLIGFEAQPSKSYEEPAQSNYSSDYSRNQTNSGSFGKYQQNTTYQNNTYNASGQRPAPAQPRVLSRSGPGHIPTPPDKPAPAEINFEHLKLGDNVMHSKFGVGKVTQIIGEGNKELYNIEFQSSGKRLLDPKFAKLVKLD